MSNLTETVTWEQFVNKVENGEEIDANLLNAAAQALANRTAWLKQLAEAHAGSTNNPHGTTPAQIGAETPSGAQARVNTHAALLDAHGASVAASAGRIPIRNAAGNFSVNDPINNLDVVNKQYADVGHANRHFRTITTPFQYNAGDWTTIDGLTLARNFNVRYPTAIMASIPMANAWVARGARLLIDGAVVTTRRYISSAYEWQWDFDLFWMANLNGWRTISVQYITEATEFNYLNVAGQTDVQPLILMTL